MLNENSVEKVYTLYNCLQYQSKDTEKYLRSAFNPHREILESGRLFQPPQHYPTLHSWNRSHRERHQSYLPSEALDRWNLWQKKSQGYCEYHRGETLQKELSICNAFELLLNLRERTRRKRKTISSLLENSDYLELRKRAHYQKDQSSIHHLDHRLPKRLRSVPQSWRKGRVSLKYQWPRRRNSPRSGGPGPQS